MMILFIIMIVIIISFIVFIFVSNKSNEKFANSSLFKRKNNYVLTIDEENDLVIAYDKENSVSYKYTVKEYKSFIDSNDLIIYNSWIEKCKTNEYDKSIIIAFHNIDNKGIEIILKLRFDDYKDGVLYLIGNEINLKDRLNIEEADKMTIYDSSYLNKYVSSRIKEIGFKGYQIFCINFNKYDLITERYGIEVAKQYVKQCASSINELLNDSSSILFNYNKDTFIVYSELYNRRIKRIKFAKYLYNELRTYIYVDIYQFDLLPSIGISLFQSYSTSITSLISEAYQASLYVNKNRFRIFDSSIIEGIKNKNFKYNEYKNIKDNLDNYISFHPIHSLITGNIIGYVSKFIINKKYFKNIDQLFNYSKDNHDNKNFINKYISSILDSYIKYNDKKTLYIYGNPDMFNALSKCLDNNELYNSIKFVFIILNYKRLLDESNDVELLIEQSKKYHIDLGLVASNLMTTSISKLMKYFKWLLIPSFLSKDIYKNDASKNNLKSILYFISRYNYRIISTNIDNFKDASILKELGVNFMEGSLFDRQDSSDYVSIRQISKLMDSEED